MNEEKEKKPLKPGQNGGPRVGSGRPKGSRNIYSKDSVKKLEELGFDPIEQLVNKFYEIQEVLTDGTVRAGSGAYAQLIATQSQIVNNLMQYGYKKVPEKQEIEVENKKPVAIKLTMDSKKEEK